MDNANKPTNAPQGGEMRLYAAITRAYAEQMRMMRGELKQTQLKYRRTRFLLWLTNAVSIAALGLGVWIAATY